MDISMYLEKLPKDLTSRRDLDKELAKLDLVAGDKCSLDPIASIWMGIIQAHTGKYNINFDLSSNAALELCKRSMDWREIVHELKSALSNFSEVEFLEECHAVQEMCKSTPMTEPGLNIQNDALLRTLKYFPNTRLYFYGNDGSIEEFKSEEPIQYSVLFMKQGPGFVPIVPRRKFFNNSLSEYVEALIYDFSNFDLVRSYAKQWIETAKISASHDPVQFMFDICTKVITILQENRSFSTITRALTALGAESSISVEEILFPLKYLVALEIETDADLPESLRNFRLNLLASAFKDEIEILVSDNQEIINEQIQSRRDYMQQMKLDCEELSKRRLERQKQIETNLSKQNLLKQELQNLSIAQSADPEFKALFEAEEWLQFCYEMETLSPSLELLQRIQKETKTGTRKNLEELIKSIFNFLPDLAVGLENRPFLRSRAQQSNEQDWLQLVGIFNKTVNFTPHSIGKILEFRGENIILSDYRTAIQNRLTQDTEEVRLLATGTLYIDESFKTPGRNIVLMGQHIRVVSNSDPLTIDASGTNGADPPSKPSGSTVVGGSGKDGMPGQKGQSSGNVHIESRGSPILNVNLLRVVCHGGNGGNGQDGGDGGRGKEGEAGKHGIDKDQPSWWGSYRYHSEGKEGTPGGHGGAPGNGGKRGIPGSAGSIKVISNKHEIKSNLFEAIKGRPGQNGRNGRRGHVGLGGKHGVDVGWAKRSMWWWDPWVGPVRGKLLLKPVGNTLKEGYEIEILKSEAEYQEERYVNTASIDNQEEKFNSEINSECSQTQVSKPKALASTAEIISEMYSSESTNASKLLEQLQNTKQEKHIAKANSVHAQSFQNVLTALDENKNETSALKTKDMEDELLGHEINQLSLDCSGSVADLETKAKYLDNVKSKIGLLFKQFRDKITQEVQVEREISQTKVHALSIQRKSSTSWTSKFSILKFGQPQTTPIPSGSSTSNTETISDRVKRIQSLFDPGSPKAGAVEECLRKCFLALNRSDSVGGTIVLVSLEQIFLQLSEHKKPRICGYTTLDYISRILPYDISIIFSAAEKDIKVLEKLYAELIIQNPIPDKFLIVLYLRNTPLDSRLDQFEKKLESFKETLDRKVFEMLEDVFEKQMSQCLIRGENSVHGVLQQTKRLVTKQIRHIGNGLGQIKAAAGWVYNYGIAYENVATTAGLQPTLDSDEGEEIEYVSTEAVDEIPDTVSDAFEWTIQNLISILKELRQFDPVKFNVLKCCRAYAERCKSHLRSGDQGRASSYDLENFLIGLTNINLEIIANAQFVGTDYERQRLIHRVLLKSYRIPYVSTLDKLKKLGLYRDIVQLLYIERFQSQAVQKLNDAAKLLTMSKVLTERHIPRLIEMVECSLAQLNFENRIKEYNNFNLELGNASNTSVEIEKYLDEVQFRLGLKKLATFESYKILRSDCTISNLNFKRIIEIPDYVPWRENEINSIFEILGFCFKFADGSDLSINAIKDYEDQINKMPPKLKKNCSTTYQELLSQQRLLARRIFVSHCKTLISRYSTADLEMAKSSMFSDMQSIVKNSRSVSEPLQVERHFEILILRLCIEKIIRGECADLSKISREVTSLKETHPVDILTQLDASIRDHVKGELFAIEMPEYFLEPWAGYTVNRNGTAFFVFVKALVPKMISNREEPLSNTVMSFLLLEACKYVEIQDAAAQIYKIPTVSVALNKSTIRSWQPAVLARTKSHPEVHKFFQEICQILLCESDKVTQILSTILKSMTKRISDSLNSAEGIMISTCDAIYQCCNQDAATICVSFLEQCEDCNFRGKGPLSIATSVKKIGSHVLLNHVSENLRPPWTSTVLENVITELVYTNESNAESRAEKLRTMETIFGHLVTQLDLCINWTPEEFKIFNNVLNRLELDCVPISKDFINSIGALFVSVFKSRVSKTKSVQWIAELERLESVLNVLYSKDPHQRRNELIQLLILLDKDKDGTSAQIHLLSRLSPANTGNFKDLICKISLNTCGTPFGRELCFRLVAKFESNVKFQEDVLNHLEGTNMETLRETVADILRKHDTSWFRYILSETELWHWDHAILLEGTTSYPYTALIDKLINCHESQTWLEIFEVQHLELLLDNLAKPVEQADASAGKLLEDAFHESRIFANRDNAEVELMEILHQLVELAKRGLQMQSAELIYFLKHVHYVPINDLKRIVESKLPQNWTEALLRRRIELSFTSIFPAPATVPAFGSLSSCKIYRLRFLAYLAKAITQEEETAAITNTNHSNLVGDNLETVLDLVTKNKIDDFLLDELERAKSLLAWPRCFHTVMYIRLGLSEATIRIALSLDARYCPNLIRRFISYLNSSGYTDEKINQVLKKIKRNIWALDESIMNDLLKGQDMSETAFESNFSKHMQCLKDSRNEGEVLIQKLEEDELNSWMASEETRKLSRRLRDHRLNARSEMFNGTEKFINEWDEGDIRSWAEYVHDEVRTAGGRSFIMDNLTEVLKVINQGIYHKMRRITLRDTQIASVLLFLNQRKSHPEKKGRFAEISTGEGKTVIIATLSLVLALSGENVDICTSSSVLAKESFDKTKDLFNLFDVNVGVIGDQKYLKSSPADQRKVFQESQVLYADLSSLQTAELNTKFFGKDITGGRIAGALIVDEADSMLLDKAGHRLYISHSIPELKYLSPLLLKIWAEVNKPRRTKASVIQNIKEKFQNGQLKCPAFLKDYVEARLPSFIRSAYAAMEEELDDNYTLTSESSREGRVTIMDIDTGVEQVNMEYALGHQQFLQFKHGDRLSCESLKAVFTSNYSYFSQFKGTGGLFGLTGTLGSKDARNLLGRSYNVDFFRMPRYRNRIVTEIEEFITPSRENWLQEILQYVENISSSSPVLIICRTKKIVGQIAELLQGHFDKKKVIPYTSSFDKNFTEVIQKSKLTAGIIIVSTNLAGRGTDLDIDEKCVEGLHVVIAYVPLSSRVKIQAEGRTGRMGKPGTTRTIAWEPHLHLQVRLEELEEIRDTNEAMRIQDVEEFLIPQIQIEDDLFKRFTEYKDGLERSKELSSKLGKGNVRKTRMSHLQNRWAFWLDSMTEKIQAGVSKTLILEEFEKFKITTNAQIEEDNLSQSPIELVRMARVHEEDKNLVEAYRLLALVIETEPDYNFMAHYYMGILVLKMKPKQLQNNSSGLESLEKYKCIRKISKNHLLKSRTAIQKSMDELKISVTKLLIANAGRNEFNAEIYMRQVANESNILLKHTEAIDRILGQDLSPQLFHQGVSQNTLESESQELYDAVILLGQKEGLPMKSHRISKKFISFGDTSSMKFEDADDSVYKKSLLLSAFREEISERLDQTLKSGSRNIDSSIFDPIIPRRNQFWNQMNSHGLLEDEKNCKTLKIQFPDKEEAFEFPPGLPGKTQLALNTLHEHNYRIYKSELLSCTKATPEELQIIEDCLIKHNVLHEVKLVERKLVDGMESRLEDENDDWIQKHKVLLQDFCYTTAGEAGLGPRVQKLYISQEDLACLPSNGKCKGGGVFQDLIRAGVIKVPALDFKKLQGSNTEEKVEALKSFIKEREELNELFRNNRVEPPPVQETGVISSCKRLFVSSERDKYDANLAEFKENVANVLLSSAGQLKTLTEIRVDYKTLEEYYTVNTWPEELIDYVNQSFERVPILNEYKSFWSTGACLVAMLSILQVALGAGILVASAGTLSNLAMILISEGGSDMLFCLQSAYNQDFSWKSYGINKAFSVAVSVGTGGLAGLMNMGTGVTIGRIGMEMAEEVLKHTAKHVGKYVLQGGVGIFIDKMLDQGRKALLAEFRDKIETIGSEMFRTEISQIFGDGGSARRLFHLTHRKGQAIEIINKAYNSLLMDTKTSFQKRMTQLAKQMIGHLVHTLNNCVSKLGIGGINVNAVLETLKLKTSLFKYIEELKSFVRESMSNFHRNIEERCELLQTQPGTTPVNDRESLEEFQKYCETVQNRMTRDLVDKVANKVQEELVSPALQEGANYMISKGFENYFNKGLERSAAQARTALQTNTLESEENVIVEGQSAASVEAAAESEEMSSSLSRLAANVPGQTVASLNRLFSTDIRFYEDRFGQLHAVLESTASFLTTAAVSQAREMNIPIIQRIQLPRQNRGNEAD